jgi:hypothetical protein
MLNVRITMNDEEERGLDLLWENRTLSLNVQSARIDLLD